MNTIDDLIEFFEVQIRGWNAQKKDYAFNNLMDEALRCSSNVRTYQYALEKVKELKTNMEKNNVSI